MTVGRGYGGDYAQAVFRTLIATLVLSVALHHGMPMVMAMGGSHHGQSTACTQCDDAGAADDLVGGVAGLCLAILALGFAAPHARQRLVGRWVYRRPAIHFAPTVWRGRASRGPPVSGSPSLAVLCVSSR
jgi:hypothetical protein